MTENAQTEPDMTGEGLLDIPFDEIPELHPLPDGEHDLQLLAVYPGNSPKGGTWLRLYFQPVDDPDAEEVGHFVGWPDRDHDDRENKRRGRALRELCTALELDISSTNFQEILTALQEKKGATVSAVTKQKDSGGGYGIQANVSAFIAPK